MSPATLVTFSVPSRTILTNHQRPFCFDSFLPYSVQIVWVEVLFISYLSKKSELSACVLNMVGSESNYIPLNRHTHPPHTYVCNSDVWVGYNIEQLAKQGTQYVELPYIVKVMSPPCVPPSLSFPLASSLLFSSRSLDTPCRLKSPPFEL